MSDYDDYGYGYDDFGGDDPPGGYVIVGWRANFKYGVATEAMAEAFANAAKENAADLRHFLPGRSQYAEHYPCVIFGTLAKYAESEDGPSVLDPAAVINLLNQLPDTFEIPEQVKQDHPFFEELASEAPKIYLMTDGPLPCAAVLFGNNADEFPADVGGLNRFMCTNMRQEGAPDGAVWGVQLEYVEHDDVLEIDLSGEARASHAERASALENPKYYLCVRYD